MTVRFDNVTYRYPDGAAGVYDIDLEIAAGEFLAVIGPSGSGKTTLIKLLAGFATPQQGRILIEGRDVTTMPPQARQLGIVFQNYSLFPHMSVWENIAYPLKVRGVGREERRRRALVALESVGLGGFAERAPGSMSGGQQQRVALARAIVFEPRALLLDEPLSALDASLRHEMRDEIIRVQRGAGIATMHVTHDQEEALSMGSRVAVMQAGRVVQVAAPRDLYDRPVNRAVAAFVGQANLWPGTIECEGFVRVPFGRLACETGSATAGSAATVLVRPENVVPLDGPGRDLPNVFEGRIALDRFLGAVRRIDLAVGDSVITADTGLRGPVDALAIPPGAIRLLPDDMGSR